MPLCSEVVSLATHVLQLDDQRLNHLEGARVHVLGGEDGSEPSSASFRGSKPPALGASFSEQRRVEPRSPGFETARRRNYEGKKAVFDRATTVGYTGCWLLLRCG